MKCKHCGCELKPFMWHDWIDINAEVLGWICTKNPSALNMKHEPEENTDHGKL